MSGQTSWFPSEHINVKARCFLGNTVFRCVGVDRVNISAGFMSVNMRLYWCLSQDGFWWPSRRLNTPTSRHSGRYHVFTAQCKQATVLSERVKAVSVCSSAFGSRGAFNSDQPGGLTRTFYCKMPDLINQEQTSQLHLEEEKNRL